MNVYEIRYGNTTEVVEGDARGVRAGRIPAAVRAYAATKLDYLIRHGSTLGNVEVSLLELTNVTTGVEGCRRVLGVVTAEEVARVLDNGPTLG